MTEYIEIKNKNDELLKNEVASFRVADGILINTSGHLPRDITDFQMELETHEIEYIRNGDWICILKLETTKFNDNFEENIEKIEAAKAFWFDICDATGISLRMYWREFYIDNNHKDYVMNISEEE
jgi:hypothetical protein